jgi:L-ascorbate metabolism protein UlaG (beta-lactamase superfamily)
VLGEPLAFLIEMGGRRIYIDSGGTVDVLPPDGLGPVDLAILGVAVRDSRERLTAALQWLQPRYVLPSHQDDFFQPLEKGFKFAALTDMAEVRREHARSGVGQLILLDYFRPWTLP